MSSGAPEPGGGAGAVLVAAGRGTRMGDALGDKLWIPIAGRPVIAHTWGGLDGSPDLSRIVVVVAAGRERAFEELAAACGFRKPFRVVAGGRERQDSVWNGLEALDGGEELVAIQDGARPCTSAAMIRDCLAAAREEGAAVAAAPVTDTIKEADDAGRVARHLDRSRLWAVATPQAFRTGVIRRALGEVRRRGLVLTDDTAACDLIGQPVRLVPMDGPNPKLTHPSDVAYLELLLGGTGMRPGA